MRMPLPVRLISPGCPCALLPRILLCAALLTALPAHAEPEVLITTSLGDIVLDLNAEKAPETVENFLDYVDAGFYDGTIFHRVISGFMVQGGGFDADYRRKPVEAPIDNEAINGLSNVRYSVAMARTNAPHSATAQFFINTEDNLNLDHSATTPRGWGYAVFGRVVSGTDVVDEISQVATGAGGSFSRDAPLEQVVIESVSRLDAEAESTDDGASASGSPDTMGDTDEDQPAEDSE